MFPECSMQAHHRRGMARRQLGNLTAALQDFEIVQQALPDNAQVLPQCSPKDVNVSQMFL
jgi:regulator of sirC expression with transglutaminase-like and TPR domain